VHGWLWIEEDVDHDSWAETSHILVHIGLGESNGPLRTILHQSSITRVEKTC
jgi:hypothetical protein